MKINDVITYNQLDEINTFGLGQKIAQPIGNAVRGTKDFISGIKSGYRVSRTGQTSTQTTNTGTNIGTQSTPNVQPTNTNSIAQPNTSSGPMKAVDIVKDLDTVWSKATADQGSQTSSPQVQQKIISMAKTAGLSGVTIRENQITFHSKFLNMDI